MAHTADVWRLAYKATAQETALELQLSRPF